jgi:hypothetical protein
MTVNMKGKEYQKPIRFEILSTLVARSYKIVCFVGHFILYEASLSKPNRSKFSESFLHRLDYTGDFL